MATVIDLTGEAVGGPDLRETCDNLVRILCQLYPGACPRRRLLGAVQRQMTVLGNDPDAVLGAVSELLLAGTLTDGPGGCTSGSTAETASQFDVVVDPQSNLERVVGVGSLYKGLHTRIYQGKGRILVF